MFKQYNILIKLKKKLKLKKTVYELVNLQKLYLDNNQLTTIPSEIKEKYPFLYEI